MAERGSKHPTLPGAKVSDTQLIDHLQSLIERRGSSGNTGSVTIEYEEHGPLMELWAGDAGGGGSSRAKGVDIRAMLTQSMQRAKPIRRRGMKK